MRINSKKIKKKISGRNVILENIQLKHFYDLSEYSKIKSFYRYFEYEHFKTSKQVKSYLNKIISESKSKNTQYWAIIFKNEKKCVGTICVKNFNRTRNSIEIGYGLNPKYQNKSLFNESLKILLNYLSKYLKIRRVYAITATKNSPSIYALKKLKFKIEGEMVDFYKSYKEKYFNAFILSRLFKKN